MARTEDPMSNIYQVKVGRLLEVRLDSSVRTTEDVDRWFAGVGAAMRVLSPGVRAVVMADWRSCPLLSDEASERARLRLTQSNDHVERSAALVFPDSAISVLQFLRLCRDSGTPNRRLFTEEQPAMSFLGEVLNDAEKRRLAAFLAEYDASSGGPAQRVM
jgi:hypothetical protein